MLEVSPPAIEVKDLTVKIGYHTLLDTVSFTIPTGKMTAIIGPNGAGKSVLLKTILRLIPKTQGQVRIFGQPHEKYKKVAALVSYIPQRLEVETNFPLTIRELFSLKSVRPLGFTKPDRQRMEQLTELVGVSDQLDQPLNRLSGGQLQRVLIGYSLMDRPQLLLLDEPSAGIDVRGQETIYSLLKRIQDENHLTIVLVSHELEIVLSYAQQVLCLNKQLLCAGVPREVLSHQLLEHMYGMPIGHFKHNHH